MYFKIELAITLEIIDYTEINSKYTYNMKQKYFITIQ